MLLAMDTSTGAAGVALHSEEGPVASLSWRAGRMHTVQLVPAINGLMDRVGVSPQDLTCIGVATGPGSFTGVRVGLATAKGISAALGVPLVGVGTLLYTAWPWRLLSLPIRACLPIGRGRLAVAAYEPEGSELRLLWMRNLAADEVDEPGPLLFCGEIDERLRSILGERGDYIFQEASSAERNPAVLAELAWERLLRGETDNPSSLQAEYLTEDKGASSCRSR